MPETFLHHNRGVKKLAYTVRINRDIRYVALKPFNKVLIGDDAKFIVTKGTCATARKLGRTKLVPYTGKWPRCALIWQVIKEVVND
ncbi:hypothetical protein [Pseudomonas rubra]|uniref:Uncharacterized protein n=1 Tax=Pseudomonas rubra TaxID=2942627 RepID=A0ABT5P6G3_9PSED|nr:hypothetical protein [Pseudomonas rubra]MDD1013872.1 hypothetical protein [Pseudomonas rubra]MDD1038307.1 hypothetical protein [Pseudomonas rubra]MDD1154603.1 hypothetical protein [Pseudomonas rubra]